MARRFAPLRSLAPLVLALATACSAADPTPSPLSADEHRAAWTKWRDSRVKFLETPGRPMSYTSLQWLPVGTTRIGADSANGITLEARDVPAIVGTLVREGKRVRFEPQPGLTPPALVDSQPATGGWLRTDADSAPSWVLVGRGGFRILVREDSVGVRTWDADRASKDAVAPLAYFDLDAKWRSGGRLMRAAAPETLAVPTTAGVGETHIIIGTVKTRIGDHEQTLTAFAGNGPTDLFFSFSDETSGEETYGFRFLHAALDTVANMVTLDFNFAYNPDCAFSAFTTCPLPPTENRVPVRITAGERAVTHVRDEAPPARGGR